MKFSETLFEAPNFPPKTNDGRKELLKQHVQTRGRNNPQSVQIPSQRGGSSNFPSDQLHVCLRSFFFMSEPLTDSARVG